MCVIAAYAGAVQCEGMCDETAKCTAWTFHQNRGEKHWRCCVKDSKVMTTFAQRQSPPRVIPREFVQCEIAAVVRLRGAITTAVCGAV